MANAKVVFFTALAPGFREMVTDEAPDGLEVITAPVGLDDDEKIELAKDADFLLLFPGVLSDRVMQSAQKCRLIQLLSAGYDRAEIEAQGRAQIAHGRHPRSLLFGDGGAGRRIADILANGSIRIQKRLTYGPE